MDVKIAVILSVSLCIFSFQCLIITTKAEEGLIKRLCSTTPSPKACKTCLESHPNSTNADEIGLAESSLTCVATDMHLLSKSTTKLKERTKDPAMKDALGICLDRLEGAKSKINGISSKVKSREFKVAQGMIEFQILWPVFGCSRAIKSKGLQVPEVVFKGTAHVARDSNNVLAILASLK